MKNDKKACPFPVTASQALRIALEDTETIYFIKSNFLNPEKNSKIISQKWISEDGKEPKWKVAIIEKPQNSFLRGKEMWNIALIELDIYSGEIIRRQFFCNIFQDEFKEKICKEEKEKILTY